MSEICPKALLSGSLGFLKLHARSKTMGNGGASYAGGRCPGGINNLHRDRMLETCDGMQAHVEVLIQQTRASQAVLSVQLGPKQTDALGELRLRDDRQEQVVAQ